jgi:ribosomal protein S19E (S16A)
MKHGTLTDYAALVMEAVDALGGDVHITELKGAIRWQARAKLAKVLTALSEQGFLAHYARGRYALTPTGRSALAQVSVSLAA